MIFKAKPKFDQLDQYLGRREYNLALEAITDEIKRRPENFNLLLRQAEILGLAGDRDKAIEVYRQIVEPIGRAFDPELVLVSGGFDAPPEPFSVKPDKKVTARDLMAIHRDVYEGTPFDQTKNPLAGPFGTPNRWSLARDYKPAEGYMPVERMIAVHQCSYVTVLQARAGMPPWIGSLAWFAPDDAKTSVFTPFYAGNLKVPAAFEIGRRDRFDRNSAWWASNFIGNWSNLNWRGMMIDIRAKQKEIEDKLFADQPVIEKIALDLYKTDPDHARTFISDYSNRVAQENFMKWWELADKLITDYQDGGSRTTPEKRTTPADWLQKQGPIGTPLPPAPVTKDEPKAEKK